MHWAATLKELTIHHSHFFLATYALELHPPCSDGDHAVLRRSLRRFQERTFFSCLALPFPESTGLQLSVTVLRSFHVNLVLFFTVAPRVQAQALAV